MVPGSLHPFGCHGNHTPRGTLCQNEVRGVSPWSNPPQDGPPNLGIARIWLGVFLVASLPIFTDFSRLSWEIIPSHK